MRTVCFPSLASVQCASYACIYVLATEDDCVLSFTGKSINFALKLKRYGGRRPLPGKKSGSSVRLRPRCGINPHSPPTLKVSALHTYRACFLPVLWPYLLLKIISPHPGQAGAIGETSAATVNAVRYGEISRGAGASVRRLILGTAMGSLKLLHDLNCP